MAPQILPRQPPRNLEPLGVDKAIGFMVRVRLFVAWIIILCGGLTVPVWLMVLVASVTSDDPKMPIPGAVLMTVFFGGQLGLGLWWRAQLKRTLAWRRRVLERGEVIRGVVESVAPALGLSLAMGGLDKRLKVSFQALDGSEGQTSFTTPLGLAAGWLEEGATIEGLEDPETGDILFPAELGLDARFG